MNQLSQDEKDILESVEQGEWQSIENLSSEMSRYQQYAQAALKKDKRINIRISSNDLEALQFIAVEEGIPYQTLVTSILHKFVTRRLFEKDD